MKNILYCLLFGASILLCEANAKENECKIDVKFTVTKYDYEPEITVDAEGNKHTTPLLDSEGKPLLDKDGKPKYKLHNPLTINFMIEGSYTITHKDGTKDGPHKDFKISCPTTVGDISPPENITEDATDRIGRKVISNLKNDLLKESCEKNECKKEQ